MEVGVIGTHGRCGPFGADGEGGQTSKRNRGNFDLPPARRQILAAQSLGFRPQTILSFLHLTVLIVHWSLGLFNS